MDRETIKNLLNEYILEDPGNIITPEMAYDEEDIGMRMFEAPIVGFGAADDPIWEEMRSASVREGFFKTPREWLPGAKTVIAFFAPYTERLILGNREDKRYPGSAWLSAYKYGGAFLKNGSRLLEQKLRESGFEAFEPYASDKFAWVYESESAASPTAGLSYTSNWSVRHAAYVCGLGTFGLSRGLISEMGMAGRFGTVITSAEFTPTERKYKELYEYCIFCGKCAKNCPAGAISLEKGKDHAKCHEWLKEVEKDYPGCDACGKCQVNVPCEHRNPKQHRKG